MKASEILRKMADLIDSKQAAETNTVADASTADVGQGPEFQTMVSPLQQNLEILKKAAGIDNHFDGSEPADTNPEVCDTCGKSPCGCETEKFPGLGPETAKAHDELEIIKKTAGIPVIAIHQLGKETGVLGSQ